MHKSNQNILQFVHETPNIMNGGNGSTFGMNLGNSGNKRSSNEAGLDEESDTDGEQVRGHTPTGSGLKPGKKTKGRVKIKMEFIENKLRRYTTFSKRKTGIMKKAYELSTLTGTQVMLLVASETGHVYTFATRKLQPMITSESGKALIQTCLNSPDPPAGQETQDQRMNPTGFEETELTYTVDEAEGQKEGSLGKQIYVSTPGLQTASGSPSPSSDTSQQHIIDLGSPQQHQQQQQQQQQSQSSLLTQSIPQPVAMTSLIPQTTMATGTTSVTKSTNVTMQLPTGGLASYIHQGNITPGTPITIPIQQNGQQQTQQQTVYRIPTQGGQVVTIPANQLLAQAQPQTTAASPAPAHQNSSHTSTAASVVPVPNANPANPSQQGGAFMYQTPQGLVYAAAPSTPGLSGLPEGGYILNLQPQTPTLSVSSDQPAALQQYITIPVPVSYAGAIQQAFITPSSADAGDNRDRKK